MTPPISLQLMPDWVQKDIEKYPKKQSLYKG